MNWRNFKEFLFGSVCQSFRKVPTIFGGDSITMVDVTLVSDLQMNYVGMHLSQLITKDK